MKFYLPLFLVFILSCAVFGQDKNADQKAGDQAAAAAAQAEKRTAAEIEILLARARSGIKLGQYADAMQVLRRIQASAPTNAEAYFLFGQIYLVHKDEEKAILSFKTALFWNINLVGADIALGKLFLAKKSCAQARAYAAAALLIAPASEETLQLNQSARQCAQ